MNATMRVFPWERQPREGEWAYAAFLAYRDLGPWRTLEATRIHLGKKPGYLRTIEGWSGGHDWRGRAGDWDARLKAERDKVAVAEAEKWERRRLQALEDGWRTCQLLRARLDRILTAPPEPEAPALTPLGPAEEAQA